MISAHLASIPSREELLKQTLASVVPYVDRTFVALNSYQGIPSWLYNMKGVHVELFDNSLGDAYKFAFIKDVTGLAYVFDDDLVYGSSAMAMLREGAMKYNCPVSFHGKSYKKPFKGFKYFSGNYRCLNTVEADTPVDVIGTGTMCFDVSQVKLSLEAFPVRNMSDIWFSKLCKEQKVPMMVIAHKEGTHKYLHPHTTIWKQTHDYSLHNGIIKNFL